MKARQPRLRAACVALLLAAVASSCSGGSSDSDPSQASGAQTARSTPSAPSQAKPALSGADTIACNGVQAILSHITVDTARWSPTIRPFDNTIAERLSTQTRYLNQQALSADSTVRVAVAVTAKAFGQVSNAIVARSRVRLNRAINHSRSAYSQLKKVCNFSS